MKTKSILILIIILICLSACSENVDKDKIKSLEQELIELQKSNDRLIITTFENGYLRGAQDAMEGFLNGKSMYNEKKKNERIAEFTNNFLRGIK
jgi:hypothetical protein